MKQNKKAKICFVICFAGFFFLKFFCYEVIVKQKIYKRPSNYYCARRPTMQRHQDALAEFEKDRA
jgi:hypothetical protein